MRTLSVLAAVVIAVTSLVPAGTRALERSAAPAPGDAPAWASGSTCSIAYYNICTGWFWLWSNWLEGERIGVSQSGCGGSDCDVLATWMYVDSAAPAGRGFTGTIALFASDANDCPTGVALATAPHLPASGWNVQSWGSVSVPSRFATVVELRNSFNANPTRYTTDAPAAGPTGPPACGTCYPTTRVTHTYIWGTAASPLCPGNTFNDGVCNAELLWRTEMGCTLDLAEDSWARVKHMYR